MKFSVFKKNTLNIADIKIFVYYKMTSLGEEAYVGTLTFKELKPFFQPPQKKQFLAGYFNNIFQGASNSPKYMEWTNNTTGGSGQSEITPMVFPYKCKLVSSSISWLSTSPIALTGTERADIAIGTYTNNAGGVGNNANWSQVGALLHQITTADNGTFPRRFATHDITFDAGDALSVRSVEQGTIIPNTDELQMCFVFEEIIE